jgi:predicted  nucleic acid-binding Zn-ribbon protein
MSDELAEAKQLIKTLQGQVSSLQYTKNHDYKFLVDENRRLEQELNEAKVDNKRLAQQIEDMASKLRDSNF